MKKLIFLVVGVFLIWIFGFVFAVEFSNVVSTCDAEDTETIPGTFSDNCNNSNLEINDNHLENHTYSGNGYAGVRIQSVNTSVGNCGSITNVEICYEWWNPSAFSLIDCNISVDADGGGSYTVVNSTCPGIPNNPGVNCINVTANETWVCNNFFTSSGTRALAKSELLRDGGGGTAFISWDVFFFNVSYELDTIPPSLSIVEPQNTTYTTTSIDLNFSISDVNLDSCWYSDNGGFTNTTLVNCANDTYTVSQDSTTINFYANDTAGNFNNTESVTFFVDSINPSINYTSPTTNASNFSRDYIEVNVTASDTNQLSNITIRLYNSTMNEINSTNSTTSPLYINFSGLDDGIYYFNATARDDLNNQNSTSTRTVILDRTVPGYVFNSPGNDSISLNNDTLLNVTITDNLLEMTLKIYGANEFGFYDNNSLLYKRTGLANDTEVIYNWTAPVLNVTSDTQLLMHFDLEGADNATFVHDETGKNNGTKKTGEPVWNESGKFGYALGFDGIDDEITIADSNSLDLNESFSISFWTYPTDLSVNQTFLAKGSGTTTNYFIDYKTTTEIEFGFHNGSWRSFGVNASDITANQWNLITVTLNDTSNISTVYINGVDKGSSQFNYDVPANDLDLKLGSFPGFDQNFTGLIDELVIYNKTLAQSEINNIYTKNLGDWYWRIEINDTVGNLNVSDTRIFEIGSIWEVSPTNLDSVGTLLSTNVSVGVLLINNTHANKNVSINITHDYVGVVTFNETFPINLTGVGGNWTEIQINVTSPSSEGSTRITFNITATDTDIGGNSIPTSILVPVDLVTTTGSAFLITAFETVPSTVSQNNTGISLKASVVNRGQSIAQIVVIEYELPTGWTNSSGALTSSQLSLGVDEQKNYSIEIDIASNATSGLVTLYANVSGLNASGSEITSSLKTIGSANVTVNEISPWVAPVVEEVTSSSGGGGGSSQSAGGSLESSSFTEVIEVVRGGDELSFDIEVTPSYANTSLKNLTLGITGFLEQYVSVFPLLIPSIKYGETKKFTVVINAPSYKGYEEHELIATVQGLLIRGFTVKSYVEKHTIDLIIQEISFEEVFALLKEAEEQMTLMEARGFNMESIKELLKQAKSKFEQGNNKEAYDSAQEVIELKEKAFFVSDFINGLVEIHKNPRKTRYLSKDVVDATDGIKTGLFFNFLTGKSIADDATENSKTNFENLIVGDAVFSSTDVRDLLNLAIIAFDRGDYELAEKRAESAKLMLILERKGSFSLFLYLYWYVVIVAMILFSLVGMFSYRKYRKIGFTKGLINNANEEKSVQENMINSQKDYFSKKISAEDYNRAMTSSKKRFVELKKQRQKLRRKRQRIVKPMKLLEYLKIEKQENEESIKKLQKDYYVKKKISEKEYKFQFEMLTEKLAEIEGETVGLELEKEEKNIGQKKKNPPTTFVDKKNKFNRGEK